MGVSTCRVFTTIPVTIDSGESVSDVIDLNGYNVYAIYMPSAWTAANITFLASPTSSGTFQSVYNDGGTEVTVTAAASRVISVVTAASAIAPLRYVKIRSGVAATPVNQDAARTIYLICKG